MLNQLCSLLCLLPLLAPAQGIGAGDSPVALAHKRLLQIARQHRPEFETASRLVEAAEGRAVQAGLYPNPVIAYEGEEIGAGGTAGQQGGSVSQLFVTANKLTLAQLVALVDVELARIDLRRIEWLVANQIGVALVDYLEATHETRLLQALRDIAQRQVDVVRQLLDQGMATQIDLLQAQIELNRVRAQLEDAHVRQQQALHRLAATVGLPKDQLRLGDDIPELVLPHEADANELWRLVVSHSPELARAEVLRERAEATLRLEQARFWPDVAFGAGMAHDNDSGDTLTNVTVAVALPIFNRNQGNIAAARAELAGAERFVRAVEEGLKRAFASEWAMYRGALLQADRYQQEIVPAAERNLELVREAYQQGQVDFLTLLVAQRTLFDTRLQALRFQAAALRAYYRLRYLLADAPAVELTVR